jgi:hypothetical protein
MALSAQIQPVQVVDNSATVLSAYVVNYDLQAQNCQVYWWLSNESGANLYQGNWSVPQDILVVWGTDDEIILTALAADKGFTIIPPVVEPTPEPTPDPELPDSGSL